MGQLVAVYVFGSTARGDSDEKSDLDVLAVVEDGEGKVAVADVERWVPNPTGRELSISWYGVARLGQMFRNGELFAWHLYRETEPCWEALPVLRTLGTPAPYAEWAEDVRSFRNILDGVPAQIALAPENCVYEYGLIYVCVRNIAMAASWALCDQPDFSRYSPYRLQNAPDFPMSFDQYNDAMRCRLAGQRGLTPPAVTVAEVFSVRAAVDEWIGKLLTVLQRNEL